jgi:hypothetical protein
MDVPINEHQCRFDQHSAQPHPTASRWQHRLWPRGGPGGCQLPFVRQSTAAASVSISSTDLDVDPQTPGIQLTEGSTIPIRAVVTDDVQVRNVELLVNGQVVENDVAFPFDLSAIALNPDPDAATTSVQVRATDTGGNSTLSPELVFDLVPDVFAPTIVRVVPADGSLASHRLRRVTVQFSEPLAVDTFNLLNFQLFDSQNNQVAALGIQAQAGKRNVVLEYPLLGAGVFHLVLDAAAITDRAGNPLGAVDQSFEFTLVEIINHWVGGTSANWNDAGNWSTRLVPGPLDDVIIDLASAYGRTEQRRAVRVTDLGRGTRIADAPTNGFDLAATQFMTIEGAIWK